MAGANVVAFRKHGDPPESILALPLTLPLRCLWITQALMKLPWRRR